MGKAISGQLLLELTSAEPELAVSAYAGAGIPMEDFQTQGALTLSFWMQRCCYPQSRKLAQKRGACLNSLGKRGIDWRLPRLFRRPVLLLGAAVLTGLTLFLPSRILFVQVEGNAAVPARQILEAAAESGLAFGTSRRQVRSEKVKNALLSKIPQLQWAGVNTSGCVATVSVRERTVLPPAQDPVGVSTGADGAASGARSRRGEQPVRRAGWLHPQHHRHRRNGPGTAGADSPGRSGADFRLHRLRPSPAGRTGKRRGFCPDPAGIDRRTPRKMDTSWPKSRPAAQLQPADWKKSHKFMER